jgi:hypothetical protein
MRSVHKYAPIKLGLGILKVIRRRMAYELLFLCVKLNSHCAGFYEIIPQTIEGLVLLSMSTPRGHKRLVVCNSCGTGGFSPPAQRPRGLAFL